MGGDNEAQNLIAMYISTYLHLRKCVLRVTRIVRLAHRGWQLHNLNVCICHASLNKYLLSILLYTRHCAMSEIRQDSSFQGF